MEYSEKLKNVGNEGKMITTFMGIKEGGGGCMIKWKSRKKADRVNGNLKCWKESGVDGITAEKLKYGAIVVAWRRLVS